MRAVGRQWLSIVANDHRTELRYSVIETGSQWGETGGGTAERCDVLLAMLPGPAELAAARDAPLRPGSTWIDMSTANPAMAEEISYSARGREMRALQSPVGRRARSGARRSAVGVFVGPPEIWKHTVDCMSMLPVPLFTSAGQAVGTRRSCWSTAVVRAGCRQRRGSLRRSSAGLDPWAVRSAMQQSASANRFMKRDADGLLGDDDLTSYALGRCHDQLRIALSLGGRDRGSSGARRTHCRALCAGLAAVRQPRRGILAARLIAERAQVDFTARPPIVGC